LDGGAGRGELTGNLRRIENYANLASF
jgi:hypothetical protein